MISNNVYMKFETMDSREEILGFIKSADIISNSSSWKQDVLKLIKYKDEHLRKYNSKNNYRNIYAYYIKIIIPNELKEEKEVFVSRFMKNIDQRYARLLYVFKVTSEGKGLYANIVAFTRYAYKHSKKKVKKYTRDFYYDKETKKLCNKSNPNAVLKVKKGDVVKDKQGNAVKELIEVSIKESRIYVYKQIGQLTNRLKQASLDTINELITSPMFIKVVSRITVKDEDESHIKITKRKRNQEIRKINNIIIDFYNCLMLGKLIQDNEIERVNEELTKCSDEMIHLANKSFEEVQQYLINWWKENIVVYFTH